MSETYSVAVKLRLIDSVSAGLVGMAAQFAAFNRHVNGSQQHLRDLEGQLKRIKLMGVLGGAALGAGLIGLGLLKGPLDAAREYELAFTKFKTMNLGEEVNKQADHFARSATIMGVSATQLMHTMSESVGIFGSYAEAQKYIPRISALNTANSAIFQGKIGEIDEGATRALVKFMDRRGLTRDETGFNRGLDLAERIVTGSGGFIKFSDLANFSQMGGTAFRSLSDQGLVNMSLLLQEQGGARAGSSLMSIYQNLIAGRTPKKTMAMLEEMGLGSIREVHSGTLGGHGSTTATFRLNPKYAQILAADPVEFFRSIFLPQLAAHGITGEAAILKATNDLLSNRNASNQASIMTTQLLQIARDAKLTTNAMGADQVIRQYSKDPNAKIADLKARYTNLKLELGEAALPLLEALAKTLTPLLRGMSSLAHDFPTATRVLVTGFAALAALAVTGGAFTLIASGVMALKVAFSLAGGAGLGGGMMTLAGGITRLGPALAGLLPVLGQVGLVAGAGVGGYAAGRWIDNHFIKGTAVDRWRDKAIEHALAFFGNEYYQKKLAAQSAPGPAHGQIVRVTAPVHLDGKVIAKVVTHHQTRAMERPETGSSTFDGRMGMVPAGAGF